MAPKAPIARCATRSVSWVPPTSSPLFSQELYNTMEALQEAQDLTKSTFVSHVFSTTEDGKAEVMNAVQYAILAVVPIVLLNKLIQRLIPEADLDKSSVELLAEMGLQVVIMFCGIIVVHRTITYFPTYSGFRYEAFVLTNAILTFMILILSIQSQLGIKANIVYDRALDVWNGTTPTESKPGNHKKAVRFNDPPQQTVSAHAPSQADQYLDDPAYGLPNPVSTSRHHVSDPVTDAYFGPSPHPVPANGILGGGFGSIF